MNKKASKEIILGVLSFIVVFAVFIFLAPNVKNIATTGKSSALLGENAVIENPVTATDIPAAETADAENNIIIQDYEPEEQNPVSPKSNVYSASGGGGHSSG